MKTILYDYFDFDCLLISTVLNFLVLVFWLYDISIKVSEKLHFLLRQKRVIWLKIQ